MVLADDYTFQLDDTGVLLNSDSLGLPFVDVHRVVGLDSAPYRETVRDHEGQDGSFMDAEFERGREVVVEGIIYCTTENIETYLDSLKANYAPSRTLLPFYYKAPGVAERVLFVKPRGAAYDLDTLRRTGMSEIQLQMFAEDPRIYDALLLSATIPYGGEATTGFGFTNFLDTFTRSITDANWGTLDSGQTWSAAGAGAAADYDVNGTRGTITHPSTNVIRGQVVDTGFVNQHVQGDALLSVQPTGNPINMGVFLRYIDASNFYWVDLQMNTDDTIAIRIVKNVAGVLTQLTSVATGQSRSSTIPQRIECTIAPAANGAAGALIRAKTWKVGDPYPAAWQTEIIDTSHTTGNNAGFVSRAATGNTNTNPVVAFDNFRVLQGFAFNLDFGPSVPPAGAFLSVGGNRPTPPLFSIMGPITNPRIINETDSKSLDFEIILGALDTLVIDTQTRTVVLNGTVNRRDTLKTMDWFYLNPGSTFIRFGGGGGSGSLLVEYRNAWR